MELEEVVQHHQADKHKLPPVTEQTVVSVRGTIDRRAQDLLLQSSFFLVQHLWMEIAYLGPSAYISLETERTTKKNDAASLLSW